MTEDLEWSNELEESDAVQMQQYFREELRFISERLEVYQKKYLAAADGVRYSGILKS